MFNMFDMLKTCPFKGLSNDKSKCPVKSHCETTSIIPSGSCPLGHDKAKSDSTAIKSDNESQCKDGKCPIKNDAKSETCKSGTCPVPNQTPTPVPEAECPMGHGKSKSTSLQYNTNANDLVFNSLPLPGQTEKLDTERVVSTIPKGETTPSHQQGANNSSGKWVYPSEQQYYNAIKRKGYDFVEPKDIPHTLAIHNSVNEKGWMHIRQWEALRGNLNPVLKSMQGKPQETTIRAYFKHYVSRTLFPFDRHDWIVLRNGKEVRYIIDFYSGDATKKSGQQLGMYLDVRPAPDSFENIYDIVSHEFRSRFAPHTLPKTSLLALPEYHSFARAQLKKDAATNKK